MLKRHYKKFHRNKYIVKFSAFVNAENLWHFHRESVAKGIAVGVACGWIPLPFHTVIAIFLAIVMDCNIPLAVTAIWVANPLTMPFMYYFAYELGRKIMGVHLPAMHAHLTMQYTIDALHELWQPVLLGCLICALVSGLVVYLSIHIIWPSIHHKFK